MQLFLLKYNDVMLYDRRSPQALKELPGVADATSVCK